MYGSGFQTWEYSPQYAIRSYAYILLHVLPASIVKDFLLANKVGGVVLYYTCSFYKHSVYMQLAIKW